MHWAIVAGLYGAGYLIDKTGDTIDKTSDSTIKLAIVGAIGYVIYARFYK